MSAVTNPPLPGPKLTEPLSVRVFEPATVYAERVGSKAVVYLDHNAWIELREGRTDDAKAALQACRAAVQAGHAVFPLSYAAVSELFHVPRDEDRRRQADLMDELSMAVTFRVPSSVYAEEAHRLYREMVEGSESIKPPRDRAFTSIPDHGGDRSMDFAVGTPVAVVEKCLEFNRTGVPYRSVRWMNDHLNLAEIRANHRRGGYVEKMDAQHHAQWATLPEGQRRLDRQAVLTQERVALFNSHVRQALLRSAENGAGIEDTIRRLAEYRERHGEGGAGRLGDTFRRLAPALEISAQIFTERQMQRGRKTEAQDFWDIEHALAPFAYADAFITLDRGLAAVLGARGVQPPSSKAKLLKSMGDFVTWLGRRATTV
jgi:hypothetical protein